LRDVPFDGHNQGGTVEFISASSLLFAGMRLFILFGNILQMKEE